MITTRAPDGANNIEEHAPTIWNFTKKVSKSPRSLWHLELGGSQTFSEDFCRSWLTAIQVFRVIDLKPAWRLYFKRHHVIIVFLRELNKKNGVLLQLSQRLSKHERNQWSRMSCRRFPFMINQLRDTENLHCFVFSSLSLDCSLFCSRRMYFLRCVSSLNRFHSNNCTNSTK